MEKVYFKNSRGERLSGLLQGDPESAPLTVICCHGMLSSKDSAKLQEFQEHMVSGNLAVLRFDFSGRGESEGELFDLCYSNQIEDLRAACDWLEEHGAQRFGFYGSSMGGTVALLTAARQGGIVCAATTAAVAYPARIEERYPDETEKWRERGYFEFEEGRIGSQFIDDASLYSVISSVRTLNIPLLITHGTKDLVVPGADADDIAAAARRVSIELFDGADHRFSELAHRHALVRQLVEFFDMHAKMAEEG